MQRYKGRTGDSLTHACRFTVVICQPASSNTRATLTLRQRKEGEARQGVLQPGVVRVALVPSSFAPPLLQALSCMKRKSGSVLNCEGKHKVLSANMPRKATNKLQVCYRRQWPEEKKHQVTAEWTGQDGERCLSVFTYALEVWLYRVA